MQLSVFVSMSNLFEKFGTLVFCTLSLVITQEPKADKDEELCKKVNENLNNPPAPGSARAGGGSGAGLPGGLPAGDKTLLSGLPAHV